MIYLLNFIPANLCILASGMHYGWPSPSLPKLVGDEFNFSVTNDEGSSIAILSLAGDIVGSIIGGFLLDRIGRKNTILLTCPPFLISWIMIASAPNIYILYSARFLAGIGDGIAFTAVPMYLGEIAEPKIRGFLCSSCVTIMIFGMLVIQGIGSHTSIETAAYFSCAVPILHFLTFLFMPESPYYNIMKGDLKSAESNLQAFRGTNDVSAEMKRITDAILEQNKSTGKFFDLFTERGNRRAVIIMIGARSIQQLSGIAAFTFYANTIFNEAGGQMSATTSTFIYFSAQWLFTAISSVILDKTGRRPLLLISIVGASIALLIEGVYFYLRDFSDLDLSKVDLIPAIALMCFVTAFSIGLQTIPILLLGELFPTKVKAFALSLADIYFGILASIVTKFFQFMKDRFGMHVPFFSFAGFCFLGLMFAYRCVPETKGKTLEDIQDTLRGKPQKLEVVECTKM